MAGYIGSTPVPQGIKETQSFTATAGQTTFNTLGYSNGNNIAVFLNGVRLINGTDYQLLMVVTLFLQQLLVLVMSWTLKHSMSLT